MTKSSQIEHLIDMVNQIASNNNYKKSDEDTAKVVINHLKKFWARPMKAQILQYAQEDGAQLSNAAKLAVLQLS